jgi:unsaturated rhamnogalacturonyl hydrolase
MSTALDGSSSAAAAPPQPPVHPATLTPATLATTGRRIADRAVAMGLSRWFWGEGVVLLGELQLADALGEPAPGHVRDFVDAAIAPGVKVAHVNNLVPGASCARLFADTGEQRYRQTCERLADWLYHDPAVTRASNGAIEHWPGGVWADTVFMAGVFCARYGVAAGRPDLLDELGRQLLAHTAILCDPATGLFAHGSHRGETIPCYWGRANAWVALAAVEFLETGGGPAYRGGVRETLTRQLLALADLQPAHGIWDVLVDGQPENRGIVETSAAAGIAAAMFRAARLGIEPARLLPAAWRTMAGLHAYVAADGTLTRTSAGTILQLVPFGYSVIRDDRIQPWGQGLALHAYAEALRAVAAPVATATSALE